MRTAICVATLCCTAAFAQSECKKDRALTLPEQGFFETAKKSAKALPAAPKGWEQHLEEITAPTKLCAEADPLFKTGQARLNLVAETEYRDLADRKAKMDAALKAGLPTAGETKKVAELTKKALKVDGGTGSQALAAEQQKIVQAQLDRNNKAMRAAGLDSEARIRISFNPAGESGTGCGYQKDVAPLQVEGTMGAFLGKCDVSSNPQDPESGVLLLFGQWTHKSDGTMVEATPVFDAKKPPSTVQAVSVVITADGKRADELLKAFDVKAVAALIGK